MKIILGAVIPTAVYFIIFGVLLAGGYSAAEANEFWEVIDAFIFGLIFYGFGAYYEGRY